MDQELARILLAVVAFVVVGGVFALAIWLKMPVRIKDDSDEHACVACESKNLRTIDTGVVVCRECGYEGGPGRGEWEARRRRAGWGDRPADERKKAALADLIEARRVALAVGPDVGEYEMDLRPDAPALGKAIAGMLMEAPLTRRTQQEERENRRQHAIHDLIEVHGKMVAASEKWPDIVPGVLPGSEKPVWTRTAWRDLLQRVDQAILVVTRTSASG